MKKKIATGILGLALAVGVMGGCAKTPEESLVKMKGEASEKNYDEAENTGKETESREQNLRDLVGAPETYQSEISDATGKLVISTDAVVEIPDAARASAINVSQHPFEQEEIDKITEIFFPDAKIYTSQSYFMRTKDVVMKELTKLKGYLAAGNLDPNNLGKDEDGNYYMDIHQSIAYLEEEYETAPETRTLREEKPRFGLEMDDGVGGTYTQDGYFDGVVEMPDGNKFRYNIQNQGSMPMEVKIEKLYEGDEWITWYDTDLYRTSESLAIPSEEELKEGAGITMEEAKALADEKAAQLGIPDMVLNHWNYAVGMLEFQGDSGWESKFNEAGYVLHYTRNLNGIPVTYTMEMGGGLENVESEMETWCYETLDFYISGDGIVKVELYNQYDIGETKTESVSLKSFDEIVDIYEKMMLIQNADILTYENSRKYIVDRITFGYSRIYEPSTDSRSGVLVPVWDFFGGFETVNSEEARAQGAPETSWCDYQIQSQLTINAIDGSVINRSLGY